MPAEAFALIDQLAAAVQDGAELSDGLRRVRDGVSAISITERSTNAEVTVTVNKDGAVIAIEFGVTAAGLPPARLSTIAMATIRLATGKIGDRYARVIEESGLGDDIAERIVANYRSRHPARFAEEEPAVARPVKRDDDGQETTGFMQIGYGTRRG